MSGRSIGPVYGYAKQQMPNSVGKTCPFCLAEGSSDPGIVKEETITVSVNSQTRYTCSKDPCHVVTDTKSIIVY